VFKKTGIRFGMRGLRMGKVPSVIWITTAVVRTVVSDLPPFSW